MLSVSAAPSAIAASGTTPLSGAAPIWHPIAASDIDRFICHLVPELSRIGAASSLGHELPRRAVHRRERREGLARPRRRLEQRRRQRALPVVRLRLEEVLADAGRPSPPIVAAAPILPLASPPPLASPLPMPSAMAAEAVGAVEDCGGKVVPSGMLLATLLASLLPGPHIHCDTRVRVKI